MCASSVRQVPGISIKTESSAPELPTAKSPRLLNPSADAFVSSRSESETSSVGDEREEAHPTAEPQHPNPDSDTESLMDPSRHPGSNDAHHYGGYGWESPQVRQSAPF